MRIKTFNMNLFRKFRENSAVDAVQKLNNAKSNTVFEKFEMTMTNVENSDDEKQISINFEKIPTKILMIVIQNVCLN